MTWAGNARQYLLESSDYFKNNLTKIYLQIVMHGEESFPLNLLMSDKKEILHMPDSLINSLVIVLRDHFRNFPNNKSNDYLNDEQCVSFLVEVICDTTLSQKVRNNAFELLNKTSNNVLVPHRERIINVLENPLLGKKYQFKLRAHIAGLINCNQKEIDRLFAKDPELPLDVQARLGNKKAISELIDIFENGKDFNIRINAINGLIFSGDSNAIRYVLRNFNKPVADTSGSNCLDNTLQYEIILKMTAYYPDCKLFNDDFNNALKYSLFTFNSDSVKSYFQKVYLWINDKYSVQPIDTQPFPYLKEKCYKK